MNEIARDVYLLRGFPPAAFNVYLLRDAGRWVLVDTASRHATGRILRQLPGSLAAIVITHAHHDHAGGMHAVATRTGAPVWASDGDADAVEGRCPEPLPERYRSHPVNRLFGGWWRDPHPVSRRLAEGDLVAGFEVIALPGHTPGHIGLWRKADRTLLVGDALRSIHLATGIPQLGEMPDIFAVDQAEARRSIRKLAEMDARTVAFGHGWPLRRDAGRRLRAFTARLAEAPQAEDREAGVHAAALMVGCCGG